MSGQLTAAVAVASLTLASTAAYAGLDPDVRCKDRKLKLTGKNALDLLKSFGKNAKKPNLSKLTQDLSKSQSRFTKGFTKAEFTGRGDSRGCATTGDASVIESKVEVYVQDVIDELSMSPSGAFVDGTSASLY